jgi:hypothetical protein
MSRVEVMSGRSRTARAGRCPAIGWKAYEGYAKRTMKRALAAHPEAPCA